jgi:uncharacterized protein with beta-barrel porin domain
MRGSAKHSKAERDALTAVTPRDPRYDAFAPRLSVWAAGYGGSSTVDGDAAAGTHTTSSRIYGADYRGDRDSPKGVAMGGARTNFNTAEDFVSDQITDGRRFRPAKRSLLAVRTSYPPEFVAFT